MIEIEIDKDSGFCFGVVNAIKKAEQELLQDRILYCLGDIVHNNLEVERLQSSGLTTIDHSKLPSLKGQKVLLRAHGEPPSTYKTATENNISIIDATCPVVLRLQQKIHKCYIDNKDKETLLVIYGKKGHAEVNGLVGQTDGTAIVIENKNDLSKLDFNKNLILFSQTTKSLEGFREIVAEISVRIKKNKNFKFYDTICRQVANRLINIKKFASRKDCIYFVADKKSSNGRILFEECLKANPNSIFISDKKEITSPLSNKIKHVGICGATSTPKWLMEEVAIRLQDLNANR